MAAKAPPIIDLAEHANGSDNTQRLSSEISKACLECGFFQIINHGVPADLIDDIMKCSKELFNLPLHVKEQYDKDIGGFNRGYERMRAQNFEKKTKGDLKEGYYFGPDLPLSHPSVVAGRFGQGPNKYPSEVPNPERFKQTIDAYHTALSGLAHRILNLLAQSLDLDPEWFSGFVQNPIATLRLLHYPPQSPQASEHERGIGAHTDFGAITILLQDMVGGLQIFSRTSETGQWIDVEPRAGAFVVNLGNLFMRWTNDRYLSNLHRVINNTGKERYSIPFFFSGNPDYVVECLPSCKDTGTGAKYPPIMVHDWMVGRYADTYGTKGQAMAELSSVEAQKGIA